MEKAEQLKLDQIIEVDKKKKYTDRRESKEFTMKREKKNDNDEDINLNQNSQLCQKSSSHLNSVPDENIVYDKLRFSDSPSFRMSDVNRDAGNQKIGSAISPDDQKRFDSRLFAEQQRVYT